MISEAKTGLELDKMEIPSSSQTAHPQEAGYRGVQQRSVPRGQAKKHSMFKTLVLISGLLLPTVLLFLLWDQGVVDLPLLKSNKVRREHERYATVGPVLTSIGENQHIKLTVLIECKDTRLKKKVADISSAVRSKLLVVLSSPEAKEKLRLRDYTSFKSHFEEEINRLLPNDSVEAVYFSEIISY
jgi:flagellar basal body-associated protein FliL